MTGRGILMTDYKAPLADMRFVMFDLLKLDQQYARIDGGANATRAQHSAWRWI